VLATILNSNFQREAMAASGVFPAYGPRATVLDETFELKPWLKSCVRIVDGRPEVGWSRIRGVP